MSRMDRPNSQPEGLCLKCAKELNIPNVRQMIDKLGLSDDDIENMNEQIMQMLSPGEPGDFERGGAMPFPFPPFFGSGMPGNAAAPQSDSTELDPDRDPSGSQMQNPFTRTQPDNSGAAKKKTDTHYKYLDGYCDNLTNFARDGKMDRIIGRESETYRVIQILNRRIKNNPCLIGEPGVGKTAIAEGIAQKIAAGDVPPRLADKELYRLDLTGLVAGTQFRGQFESRVKGLIEDIKTAGNVILYIDEVHTLVGTGDSDGSMNAANILKPALSRGEVQVIGATTFDEYRKHIEKDAALERRFQPVKVGEPTIAESTEILMGIKGYYEEYHHVHYADELIALAVKLSERYVNDRFLPDKAIDILDEAGSCASLRDEQHAAYNALVKKHDWMVDRKSAMEQNASSNRDFERIAEMKADILRLEERMEAEKPSTPFTEVTEDDIANVISLWTGIPTTKIQESEQTRVSNIEEALKKRIIGQDEAVEQVAAAVRRSRVQLSARRRPASFIFAGPTGVGKTELVKVLSEEMFDTTDPLIRLDMSEYMEKHSVSRMVGSPPGYIGYDEAGQLTEKVRRRPYSVVLFDEIEKAHPDVLNILLQILDEGRITDAQGRTVNFENTIIVMTTNAGSSIKTATVGFNKQADEIAKEKALRALRDFLRPEFLARVDEIIAFRNLDFEDFKKIAALNLDELKEPLSEKGISFAYEDSALELIAKKSFGNASGARDIRRVIRKEFEDPLCLMLVEGKAVSLIKVVGEGEELKLYSA